MPEQIALSGLSNSGLLSTDREFEGTSFNCERVPFLYSDFNVEKTQKRPQKDVVTSPLWRPSIEYNKIST